MGSCNHIILTNDLPNNNCTKKYYMKKLNRREFITKAAIGTGAALALSQLPTELFANAGFHDIPVGFQSWTIKEQLSKDFPGTLKMMSAQGYKLIEMCSPKGYATIGF